MNGCARIRSEPASPRPAKIDIYMITMAKQLTDRLDLGSKMNRDPAFVSELREHGAERGRSSSILVHRDGAGAGVKWPTRAIWKEFLCRASA